MPQSIELHYWPTPNGLKISLALEEMGLAYEIFPVNINKAEQFDPAFAAISPNNKIPAIVDPRGPRERPIALFESGAILQYLGRKTGRFYPEDERVRAEIDQWLFWQMAGLGPMAGQANHFRGSGSATIPDQRMIAYPVNRYTNEVQRLWGVLDKHLSGREFLAGDYSIADMACWPWMRSPSDQGVDPEDFPNASAWRARIAARPAAAKAVADGQEVRRRAAHSVTV